MSQLFDNEDITSIPGIGKGKAQLFTRIGGKTKTELVHVYPRRYEKYPEAKWPGEITVKDTNEGLMVAIKGQILNAFTQGKKGPRLAIDDPMGRRTVLINWIANPYITRMLRYGQTYVFYGKVTYYFGGYYMMQPKHFTLEEYKEIEGTYEPVYPLTAKLTNGAVVKVVRELLDEMKEADETLIPENIQKEFMLLSHTQALRLIHMPQTAVDIERANRRLIFEELFLFMLRVRYGTANREKNYFPMISVNDLLRKVVASLPYEPTRSQKDAINDIWRDFRGEHTANRLIQGDVGSGKTFVAQIAILIAAENGYQSVLMAPTEVLARQHYTEMCELLDRNGLLDKYSPVFLSGSQSVKEKEEFYKKIADGQAKIIVGTHAVIQDKVLYKELALVITDEQHRFGVEQRNALVLKSDHTPHVINMSATPIPQTLSHTIYGDMDISEMREKPAKRLPIKNCVIPEERHEAVWRFVRSQLEQGRQAYIICHMVEENEEGKTHLKDVVSYTEEVKKQFPDYTVDMLHGQMDPEEKQKIMDRFSENGSQILVSTTVIEVGINVPNATVIVIEDAESFGMLQLHQLRGRVGRGGFQSYCIFVNSSGEESEKLNVLGCSNDGFFIAEEDYRLRGAGQFFGERQSGSMGFIKADLIRDEEILKECAKAAESILKWDPMLRHPSNRTLKEKMLEEH